MQNKLCFLLTAFFLLAPFTRTQASPPWRATELFDYARFSNALSEKFCGQYKDPKMLKVPLSYQNSVGTPEQSLFYFRINSYNPRKPTMLIHIGGPGAVLAPNANMLDNLTSAFNVINYHSRGAGCSAEPTSQKADPFLGIESEINDIEAIRKDLKLEKWDVFYGVSAGTVIGRAYASRFPTRVGKLVISGVGGKEDSTNVQERREVFVKKVWDKFVKTYRFNILGRLSDSQVADLGKKLTTQFLNTNGVFSQLVARSLVKKEFLYLLDKPEISDPVVEQIPVFFTYLGTDAQMVDELMILFVKYYQEMGLDLAGDDRKPLDKKAEVWNQSFFQTNLDPEDFNDLNYKLAWRLIFFFGHQNQGDACHPVPQLILQGTEDMATPVGNAVGMFENTACYTGSTTLILKAGGGHGGFFSDECEAEMIRDFIARPGPFELPKSCDSKGLTIRQR